MGSVACSKDRSRDSPLALNEEKREEASDKQPNRRRPGESIRKSHDPKQQISAADTKGHPGEGHVESKIKPLGKPTKGEVLDSDRRYDTRSEHIRSLFVMALETTIEMPNARQIIQPIHKRASR